MRIDEIAALQQQLQQSEEQIKEMKGDIQTKDRELSHLEKRIETEKFKSKLNQTQSDMQATSTLYRARLQDELKKVSQKAKEGDTR